MRVVLVGSCDGLAAVRANDGDEAGGRVNFQIQMEQRSAYLAARFIGEAKPDEGSKQFESIAEHCRRTRNNKLLIDTTRLDVKLTVTTRFLVGERLESFMLGRIKVAFVVRPEQLDPERFILLVARNRFVNVEVFTDFQSAEEWLLK